MVLPTAPYKAFQAKEAEQYISKTVVLNADIDKIICILPSAQAAQKGKLIQTGTGNDFCIE